MDLIPNYTPVHKRLCHALECAKFTPEWIIPDIKSLNTQHCLTIRTVTKVNLFHVFKNDRDILSIKIAAQTIRNKDRCQFIFYLISYLFIYIFLHVCLKLFLFRLFDQAHTPLQKKINIYE
jgi:hypothetical protein